MGSTNITIEDNKKIFQDMFRQHQEAISKKQEEMFHENSIMQLISGLKNQTLDCLSKEIADLKESLEFTQEKTEGKFNKLNEKISTMEKKICSASRKTLKSIKEEKKSLGRV